MWLASGERNGNKYRSTHSPEASYIIRVGRNDLASKLYGDRRIRDQKKLIPELTAGRLRLGQAIRLDQLYFEADSTVLFESSLPVLDEIFYFLEQNPEIVIEIGGHTNGIPPTTISTASPPPAPKTLRLQHRQRHRRNPNLSQRLRQTQSHCLQ